MQKNLPVLRTVVLFIPYVVFSIVHLVALAVGADAVASFTKPLLMLTLLVGFLFAIPRWRTQVALLASLALLFSWAGDVGISSAGDLSFLVTLGFFFIAHLFYIVLFMSKLRMRRLSWWSIVYAAWWVALIAILAPHVGPLLIPVALYGLVLVSMGAIALTCNRLVALGGAFFVASDTLLGLNKFLPGFELGQIDFLIMLTYLAAQALIVLGIIVWSWQHLDANRMTPVVPAAA